MKKLALLMAALLVFCGARVLAVDYWGGPPPGTWLRGDVGTTYQHWDFAGGTMDYPDEWDNPFGTPFIETVTGLWAWDTQWECPTEMDPDGFVDGWHCTSPEGGAIDIWVPNSEDPDGMKFIFVQVTSSKAPSDVGVTGFGGGVYSSGTWSTGVPHVQWGSPAPYGGSWYTYNYGLWVYPNPSGEVVTIEVVECTVIDQIVIDTICTREPIATESSTWGEVKHLFR